MIIINGLDEFIKPSDSGIAVAIGNFDGVHIGHLELIKEMKQQAKILNLKTAILTFMPHPVKFFKSDLRLINSPEKRLQVFESLDIDYLININFDSYISNLSAEDFFHNILIKKLDVRLIAVGSNYRFGAKKIGDTVLMKKLAEESDIKTIFVENVTDETGKKVSSSRVRDLILSGDIELTNKFLDRAFAIEGKVIHGDGLGKTKLMPTVNLAVRNELIPKIGVYATKVIIDGKSFFAMSYIGLRPTINNKKELRIEANIFGFDETIYDKTIEIEFYKYIRGDTKFSNFESLKKQLFVDKKNVEDYFNVEKN